MNPRKLRALVPDTSKTCFNPLYMRKHKLNLHNLRCSVKTIKPIWDKQPSKKYYQVFTPEIDDDGLQRIDRSRPTHLFDMETYEPYLFNSEDIPTPEAVIEVETETSKAYVAKLAAKRGVKDIPVRINASSIQSLSPQGKDMIPKIKASYIKNLRTKASDHMDVYDTDQMGVKGYTIKDLGCRTAIYKNVICWEVYTKNLPDGDTIRNYYRKSDYVEHI